ncbi:MAG: hypothetical protein RL117_148 [Verrucomicrobiota bacterium]|jgi:autotransporter-associated beta strand protein
MKNLITQALVLPMATMFFASASPHLTDNFDSGSYGASSFNSSIASDQGGTLAGAAYSVYAPSADWQAQHGNGGGMLLVGDSGYAARASLQQNFATLANSSDLPVSFQMDAWVTDTSSNACWAAVTMGNGQNMLPNDIGAKFAILPELGNRLQVIVNGNQQWLAVRSGNNFTIVISDTAGSGSAFNGKGSKAVVYNGSALVGIYTLPQLTEADGFLSFSACPYNGSWNIARFDNLSIRVENPTTPLRWLLWTGNATWPADKRAAIIAAMDEAVGLYNANGYFSKNLVANYSPGVPTAQAGYSGWMDFGNSFGTRVTLHEIAHTLGCGTHWSWGYFNGGGVWTGAETSRFAKLFDGPTASIGCDGAHFWPYGLNYDNEDSASARVRHVKIVAAMRRDMGIVGRSEDDGQFDDDQDQLPDDWEMFRFGNLAQTGSGDPDQDGISNRAEYLSDQDPNLSQSNFLWNNQSATGQWNLSDANWSGIPWVNSVNNNAAFSHIGGSVNLSTSIVAGGISVGHASYNFANISLAGGSLSAVNVTVQGYGLNGGSYASNPTMTLNVPSVALTGDLAVGRSNLVLAGGSVSVNRITPAPLSADWAKVSIHDGSVRAINGIDGSLYGSVTFQLDLNGGSLYTPFLKVANREVGVGNSAWLTWNGTVVHPTTNNSSFVSLHGGNQNTYVGDGGAIFETDGYNIGLGINLLAAGNGGLTKNGEGTLTLSGNHSYTGGTIVNGGTLRIEGGSLGNAAIRGALTVNAGATVYFAGGDGTGLGWNRDAKVTSLAIHGGTVTSTGVMHIWNLGNSLTLTAGKLQSNDGNNQATGSYLEWAGTSITSLPSTTSSVIAGRIRFRPDLGTVHAINVADGAAETDLLISAAMTETSRCNLLKTGAGTLRLTGSIQMTGVINVEAGTLDFAPSEVSPSLRIAVTDGAKIKLSNAATTMVKNVYIGGQRLASGTWGAVGSGADHQSSAFLGSGIIQITDHDISHRERWRRMKYGQFTHYVWDGSGAVTRMPDGTNSPSIDYVANQFDATKFANDVESMGVEYVIFTAWHANFNPLFNSATFDRYGYGYRRSQRDMLGDMIAAVRSKGIRVLFYTHPNQPIDFNWLTHNNMINDIYAEMVDRYGDQIDGFYLDENDPNGDQNNMVDFVRLERTIRRRNPDLMFIQNFYGNLYTCDVPMGESGPASANFSKDVSWPSISAYAQVMSNTWSAQVPLNQSAVTRSPEGIFRGAVTAACSCTDGGGTAWAAGPFPGGQWEGGVLETMQAVGQLMAPVAESIKNTYPSTSFAFSNSWGGATRSTDDTKEYLHVLWPPAGNSLVLPAPTDGKVFANARLLANGQAVTLERNARALKLTLNGASRWDANDTVIVMDVVSSGDRYLANNTTAEAKYTGSWSYLGNRPTTEFGRDVHETASNGDSVEFAFNGTDVELLGTSGSNRGTVDIYLDGVFQQTVSALTSTPEYRRILFQKSGLARGNHILRAVKTGGALLTIDAFRATEQIDSAQSDVSYSALTLFNNTNTAPNSAGYIEYDGNWSWQQRDRREYNSDAHWAVANGATFTIRFRGTGVQFIGTKDGIIDFYLDGVYIKRVYMGNFGSLDRNIGLDIKGLPEGDHALTGVKVGDTYCLVDAFFVYNSQDANWSTQLDPSALGGSYRSSSRLADVATLAFQGTGIEVIAPHQSNGGTVAFSLQSSDMQEVGTQFINQYAGDLRSQSRSFESRNLVNLTKGNYLLSMTHHRSFGSVALDAFKVYKNQPDSGPVLQWGASGAGGSGTWDLNATANWWDGANATAWYDVAGLDYRASFAGLAGTVNLASNANVNQLSISSSGYLIQGGVINLNGIQPSVTITSGVTATIASTISGSSGLTKSGAGTLRLAAGNPYTGTTNVQAGTLIQQSTTSAISHEVSLGAVLELSTNDILSGPSTSYRGAGTLRKSGSGAINWPATAATFAMSSGALIDVQGGTFTAGSHANESWTSNLADLNVAAGATFNTVEANVRVNRISGSGTIGTGYSGAGYQNLSIGVDHGSSTFAGAITNTMNTPEFVGNLVKLGSGTITLSGSSSYTGSTTVREGMLAISGRVSGTSALSIQTGATLELTGILSVTGSVTNYGTMVFSGAANFAIGGTMTNYGTIINRSPSVTLPASLINYGTIINLPAAPTGLTASPNGTTASLSWNSVSGAASYRVKQATSASGPYSLIASPSNNSYAVTGLTPGLTYHFVVSAVNVAGESSNSNSASCTITSLPAPWLTADIGAVGIVGSATATNGVYTVRGSGAGVYASTDQFRMVYQNSSGDCDIIARVDSMTTSSAGTKVGVMVRESLAANARCAGVYATPSSGVQFIWRTSTGTMVNIATVSGLTVPRFVRMQRVGNSFRAYHSTNGTSWTQFGGSKTISMTTNALMGQVVTSGTNSSIGTGVFSGVIAKP